MACELNTDLRAVVCNIEMPAAVLLDRQLARLSGISAETIRYRRLDASHADRLDRGMSTLETIADRLCFVRPPFDLANVAATADEFSGRLMLLDYIQRIPPPGQHGDRRGSVDATMNYLAAVCRRRRCGCSRGGCLASKGFARPFKLRRRLTDACQFPRIERTRVRR